MAVRWDDVKVGDKLYSSTGYCVEIFEVDRYREKAMVRWNGRQKEVYSRRRIEALSREETPVE